MDYSRFFNQSARYRKGSVLRMTFKESLKDSAKKIFMAGGLPNPKTFPIKEGSFTLRDGTTIPLTPALMEDSLQYGASEGYEPLLKQLRSLTQRLHLPPRWVNSQLLVTSGGQAGLCMAIETLISHEDYVIVEEPCYCGALAIMYPYCPRFVSVETDGEGIIPEKLKAALSKWKPAEVRQATQGVPKFLYTNPNGCNPSGGVISTGRRKQIYEIASEYNLIILEDDPYYFLQFQEDFPPSFLSMDIDGRVLRFDSFSKTLSPGLRVGYVTGPQPLLEIIGYYQQVSVSHAPVLSQVIISEILRTMGEDGFLAHAQNVKSFYQEQRDAVNAAATKYLSGLCEWSVPAGGMFLWLKVLGVTDTKGLVERASTNQKVVVVPGSGFLGDVKRPYPYIRVSFSHISAKDMEEGFQRLAEAIRWELKRNT